MNKEEILHSLESLGYSFAITKEGDSKKVSVEGTCSKEPLRIKHCYSSSFTDHEIKLDLVYAVCKWAELVVEKRLTYKM